MVYYRNKQTGEIREVVPETAEVVELQAQVGQDGQPLWEQTGLHHAAAVKARAKAGNPAHSDLGHEDRDEVMRNERQVDTSGMGPDPAPHQNLTPGEIEAGLDAETKAGQLQKQFHQDREEAREAALESGAEKIADGGDAPNADAVGEAQAAATAEAEAGKEDAAKKQAAAVKDKDKDKSGS